MICLLATQSLSAFTLLFSCFKEMCFIQIIDLTTSSLLWKSIKHSLPIIVVLGLLMTNWKSKYVYQKLLLVDENYGLHRKTRRDRQKQTPLISCTPFKQKNLSTSPSTHLKLLIKKTIPPFVPWKPLKITQDTLWILYPGWQFLKKDILCNQTNNQELVWLVWYPEWLSKARLGALFAGIGAVPVWRLLAVLDICIAFPSQAETGISCLFFTHSKVEKKIDIDLKWLEISVVVPPKVCPIIFGEV